MEKSIAEIQEEIKNTTKTLAGLHDQFDELNSEYKRASSAAKSAETFDAAAAAHTEAERAKFELSRLNSKIQAANSEMNELNYQMTARRRTRLLVRDLIGKISAEIRVYKIRVRDAEQQFSMMQSALVSREQKLAEAQADLAKLESGLDVAG